MSERILILGSGIIGLCSAYYAAQRGYKVTMIDRLSEDHDGCSFGNAGMIVPSHFVPLAAPGMVALGLKWMWNPESPFYIKPRLNAELLAWAYRFWRSATRTHVEQCAPLIRDLSFASRSAYEDLASSMDFGLVKRGLMMLCQTQRALDDEAHSAHKALELGIPAEVLDSRQIAALDPNVTMSICGGVYYPKDCHLSPNQLMRALKKQCEALGVEFIWNTEVTGWCREGSVIKAATTPQGDIPADQFVLAGGSWSPKTVSGLALRLPMQAGKGYSLTLLNPRQIPELCSILCEARVAVTPVGTSLRFGGTMEMAGLDERINEQRVQGIIKAATRYFPEFRLEDFSDIKPWSGLRPCSPDGMPYLGRTKAARNLIIATGHAMMGISLGPVTGKLVAELISGETPTVPLDLLSPDRFV